MYCAVLIKLCLQQTSVIRSNQTHKKTHTRWQSETFFSLQRYTQISATYRDTHTFSWWPQTNVTNFRWVQLRISKDKHIMKWRHQHHQQVIWMAKFEWVYLYVLVVPHNKFASVPFEESLFKINFTLDYDIIQAASHKMKGVFIRVKKKKRERELCVCVYLYY